MKKLILLVYCIACSTTSFSQSAAVPDDNYAFGFINHDSEFQEMANDLAFGNACQYETINWAYNPADGNEDIGKAVFVEIETPSGLIDTFTFYHPDTYPYILLEYGSYYVNYSVMANGNLMESPYTFISTAVPEVPAGISFNIPLYIGDDYDFYCSPADFVEWTIDGNYYTNDPSFNYTFNNTGTYEFECYSYNESYLNNSDEFICSTTFTQTVNVFAAPFKIFGDQKICFGTDVVYYTQLASNFEMGDNTWQWVISGQEVGTNQYLNWSFGAPGYYLLVANILNPNGDVLYTNNYGVNVQNLPDAPEISGTIYSCETATYTIDNYENTNSYNWEVENGTITSSTASSATVNWQGQGSITVTVISQYGCVDSTTYIPEPCCNIESADYVIEDLQNSYDLIALNGGSNTINNKTIVFKGDFNAYNELNFSQCNLYLAADAKFEITNLLTDTGNVSFENSQVESCDQGLWYGFYLKKGDLNIAKSSRIYDAKYAVTAVGSQSQQRININSSTFENNYSHLILIGNIDATSKIRNNIFTTSDNLKYPYQNRNESRVAILTYFVPYLLIGESYGGYNEISQSNYGLYSKYSNIDLERNEFKDFSAGGGEGYLGGVPIRTAVYAASSTNQNHYLNANNNYFESLQTAISCDFMNTNIQHHNQIESVFTGIVTTQLAGKTSTIEYNELENTGIGIFLYEKSSGNAYVNSNLIDDGYYGIYMTSTNLPAQATTTNVHYNCIKDQTVGIYSFGINYASYYYNFLDRIKATGMSFIKNSLSKVSGNRIKGYSINNAASVGFYSNYSYRNYILQNFFRGFESCAVFDAENKYTNLIENRFDNGYFGVRLTNNGHIGPQGANLYGNPLTNDNRWTSPGFDYNFHLYSPDANAYLSPFYFRSNNSNGASPEFVPFNVFGIPAYLSLNNGQVSWVGYASQCLDPIPPSDSPFSPSQEVEAVEVALDYSPQNFMQQQILLEELSLNPELLNGRQDLQDFKAEVQELPQTKLQEVKDLAREGKYQEAQEKNDEVASQNDIIATDKAVNHIYLTSQRDSFPMRNLSANTKEQIRELASLCPLTHGLSVYSAREMAHLIDSEWINYRHQCEEGTPWIGARLAQEQKPLVYPNPNTGDFYVEASAGSQVQIRDLMGRLVLQQDILENTKNYLQLTKQKMGIYVLEIFDQKGQSIATQKLVLKN